MPYGSSITIYDIIYFSIIITNHIICYMSLWFIIHYVLIAICIIHYYTIINTYFIVITHNLLWDIYHLYSVMMVTIIIVHVYTIYYSVWCYLQYYGFTVKYYFMIHDNGQKH